MHVFLLFFSPLKKNNINLCLRVNGKRVIVGELGEQVKFLTTCTRGAESSDVKMARGA